MLRGIEAAKIAAVLAIIVGASLLVNYIYRGENGIEEFEELKACISVSKDVVDVGEKIIFDARNSSGPITRYVWDFDASIDNDGDGNPRNDGDAYGEKVAWYYTTWGTYRVTLTVYDDRGNRSMAYKYIHVTYRNKFDGNLSITTNHASHYFPLTDTINASRVYIKLVYPTHSIPASVENNLTMTLYDANDTMIANTANDVRESGEWQVEIIDITSQQVIASYFPGNWKIDIALSSPSTNVNYTVYLAVYY